MAARIGLLTHRWSARIAAVKPRHAGVVGALALIAASAGYGVVKGGHSDAIIEALVDTRDALGNAAGFRITTLSIDGRRQLTEAEVLAAAGITARTSLLFLDVDGTRQKLEANPWIVHATVRKLYPNRLDVTIGERDAFAYWQKSGELFVIAEDGTVLGPRDPARPMALPLVVGPGAAVRARDFLALLDKYPAIRADVRAAVLVAERRWNLRMKSGLDVRLPEIGIEGGLDRLVALDRDKKILSRDLTSIDLRLPNRTSVRLSDEAAQAREQAIKEKEKKKKKGGAA